MRSCSPASPFGARSGRKRDARPSNGAIFLSRLNKEQQERKKENNLFREQKYRDDEVTNTIIKLFIEQTYLIQSAVYTSPSGAANGHGARVAQSFRRSSVSIGLGRLHLSSTPYL